MTKDDYKAKIREAIDIGYEAGSGDVINGVYKGWALIEVQDAINNKIDKLVDKFLAEKDDSAN